MKLRNFIFPVIFFELMVCPIGTYDIEIIPPSVLVDGSYKMQVGQSATFTVIAKHSVNNQTETAPLEQEIWWDYSKQFLEQTGSAPASVTLQAIRSGDSKLTATTLLKNNPHSRELNITISQ